MSKHRPNLPQRESSGSQRGGQLGLGLRIAISLFLLWHLAALFMAPLSVPPSTQLAAVIAQGRPMQWYLDALHLNNGYHFFAPEPPPGFLIRYELVDTQGKTIVGEFPDNDKKEYWPRLRYHRHFMLADQASLPTEDENLSKDWTKKYLTAYARHLLRVHDGERIRIQRVVHWIQPPPLMRNPEDRDKKLNDPSTYEIQLEVTQSRRDLELDDAQRTNQTTDLRNGGWTSGGLR
jgi:hypothetical protein